MNQITFTTSLILRFFAVLIINQIITPYTAITVTKARKNKNNSKADTHDSIATIPIPFKYIIANSGITVPKNNINGRMHKTNDTVLFTPSLPSFNPFPFILTPKEKEHKFYFMGKEKGCKFSPLQNQSAPPDGRLY